MMKFLSSTSNKRWGYVHLQDFARRRKFNARTDVLPISLVHVERGIDCSYGGYLEFREDMLRGTYLDDGKKYLHLGVDFNVPTNTIVCTSEYSTVVAIDDDHPEPHGWGPRVILRTFDMRTQRRLYLIYAHLNEHFTKSRLSVGDCLVANTPFALVGNSSHNGGWFEHLHVQAMTEECWKRYEGCLDTLDGYGRLEDVAELARDFPDPLPILLD